MVCEAIFGLNIINNMVCAYCFSGTGPSLVSPLPLLHSEFPLLSAVANPNKCAVSYIQNSARDILHTVSELIAVPVFPLIPEEASTQAQPLLPLSSTNPHVRPDTPSVMSEKKIDNQRNHLDNTEENEEVKEEEEENEGSGVEEEEGEEEDGGGEGTDKPKKKKTKRQRRHSQSSIVIKEEEVSAAVCDWRLVLVLRDSGIALSSCLFQALSDSEGDTSQGKDFGVQLLYTPRRRRWSSTGIDGNGEKVITTPDKWPGKFPLACFVMNLTISRWEIELNLSFRSCDTSWNAIKRRRRRDSETQIFTSRMLCCRVYQFVRSFRSSL